MTTTNPSSMVGSSPVAGPSDASRQPVNPQLGLDPWFNYPKPTLDQMEQELPPYFESENVPLGLILDRLTLKGHEDMRRLLGETLPKSAMSQRPRLIIDFAKTQRQAVLKYLAILRWKSSVDVPVASTSSPRQQPMSFPTPQTNGSYESNTTSPAAGYVGKGKGKAVDEDGLGLARGKVTDAKRVTLLLEHQNRQHEDAIAHVAHIIGLVDGLRERNPDLLTAISLQQNGTYTRLPSFLVDSFKTPKPLTNRQISRTLRRLNRHLLYRLKCVDHLPPELIIEAVRDGKVYLSHGGEHGWKAHMTVVGFGDGDEARWWLTGVEWGWKTRHNGTDDPGGAAVRRLSEEERQQILEVVNGEVLAPRPVEQGKDGGEKHDSPLNRLFNFLQHLSLSYQLESLFSQAIEMSQGKWRGHLLAELDRSSKTISAKYWIRPRPPTAANQAPNKRKPSQALGAARAPLIGGTLRISLAEAQPRAGDTEELLRDIVAGQVEPSERILKLQLGVKWEVGEAGAGGGLKAGDVMDSSMLVLDPAALSFNSILDAATRAHAAHLTRSHATPLLSSPRITLFPLNLPAIVERDAEYTPLSLRIPLPSRQKPSALVVSVSALTGLIEIEDEGSTDARAGRARIASNSLNDSVTRLLDDLGRLITAVVAENLELQMRQLGWTPTRRLPLRTDEVTKNDLHPASSIFVPLPSSPMHYFMAKLGLQGISCELVKLVRIQGDKGIGMKLVVLERIPLDLAKIRSRRDERASRSGEATFGLTLSQLSSSSFELANQDLKDLFVFANALVAQTIVEQQLKDRSIPHRLWYPPSTGPAAAKSTSSVAGMIPTLVVQVRDLLKDGRAADIAEPEAHIQIRDWWKGGVCSAITAVQLQHKPAIASSEPTSGPANHEGIQYDAKTSAVRFIAKDISRCVPSFLDQWERLSKVLVVAGEVNRLSRTSAFDELRMISFDLRTVTFAYAAGYSASITYTPQDDSYQVGFLAEQGENPHNLMAGLLSHRLNELTTGPRAGSKGQSTGQRFISLLCCTLPLLQEVASITSGADQPVLVPRSVTEYRLVWDVQNARRYVVDVALLGDRFLVTDGNSGTDPSCGPLTPIPDWVETINKAYDALKARKIEGSDRRSPPAVKVDQGRGMLCEGTVVREIMRSLAEGVKTSLGL